MSPITTSIRKNNYYYYTTLYNTQSASAAAIFMVSFFAILLPIDKTRYDNLQDDSKLLIMY